MVDSCVGLDNSGGDLLGPSGVCSLVDSLMICSGFPFWVVAANLGALGGGAMSSPEACPDPKGVQIFCIAKPLIVSW